MDQVTLIGHNDVESVAFHLRATCVNMPWIRHTYYVVPSEATFLARLEEVLNTLDSAVRKTCTVVREDELMPLSVCENKWIYQQLVKLSIDALCHSHGMSDVFLFTDVDTICVRPCSEDLFLKDGKYVYSVAHYQGAESFVDTTFERILKVQDLPSIDGQVLSWLIGFSWSSLNLLGIREMHCVSAVNACVVWSADVLRSLKGHLNDRYKKPFHESILECFRAFIEDHKNHLYRYPGFRQIVMTYYPVEGFERVEYDPELLFRELRIGFSEWQLYTYFLSICAKHPYVIQFDPPSANKIIAEFNSEVLPLDTLRNFLRAEAGCHFLNFYPKLSPEIQQVLQECHISESV